MEGTVGQPLQQVIPRQEFLEEEDDDLLFIPVPVAFAPPSLGEGYLEQIASVDSKLIVFNFDTVVLRDPGLGSRRDAGERGLADFYNAEFFATFVRTMVDKFRVNVAVISMGRYDVVKAYVDALGPVGSNFDCRNIITPRIFDRYDEKARRFVRRDIGAICSGVSGPEIDYEGQEIDRRDPTVITAMLSLLQEIYGIKEKKEIAFLDTKLIHITQAQLDGYVTSSVTCPDELSKAFPYEIPNVIKLSHKLGAMFGKWAQWFKQGGGGSGDDYRRRYLKYKAKYLTLRHTLGRT